MQLWCPCVLPSSVTVIVTADIMLRVISQALREAAMRSMHGGTGERHPLAALGPIGEETVKEFEV